MAVSPKEDSASLSSHELSAVIVMGFEDYGKLKVARKQKNEGSSVGSINQIETPLGVNKCRVLDRLKQQQEQGGDGNPLEDDDEDDDSLSTGSCRVLKRIKEENSYKKNIAVHNRSCDNSVASSITGSIGINSFVSNTSRSSRNRRRNREALQQQQTTAILSIQEFAGFSSATKASKAKKLDKNPISPKNWFKKKRHNKGSEWSVTVASVSPASKGENPVSILRTSKKRTVSAASIPNASVRFAEGTIFQDPSQVARRKVPRLKNRKNRGSKPYSSHPEKKKQQLGEEISLSESMHGLKIVNGVSCNPIGPLVHAMACF